MPQYLFQHPETKEVIEVFQHMTEEHILIKDGVTYERVFTIPQASIDTVIDPFSINEFKNKTRNKKGMTLGEAFDESEKLSKQREKKAGFDPIKAETVKKYEKATGKKHPLTKSKNNVFDLMKDITKKK